MEAAARAGLPVPRVHAEGVWCDRPTLLLEWGPGRTLEAELLSHPWRIRALSREFGRMLARLHAVPPPEMLRVPTLDWIKWAGEVESALQERLRATASSASTLLHLDYHPRNVLTDGTQITAILDWANALAGDPRADLARTLVILNFALMEKSFHLPFRIAVPLLSRFFLQGYSQVAGPQGDLSLFLAWAWAATYRDMAAKLPEPGLRPSDAVLERMKFQITYWKRRAGVM